MPTNSKSIQYRLAVFASGGGSNAEQIIQHFDGHSSISVELILSNKKTAGVLMRAENHEIPSQVIGRKQLKEQEIVLPLLERYGITHIVLAGFLLLIPSYLIENYPNKILNIHPSLLPKYGGKGMYGMNVHKAVKANKDIVSGLTIHLVNEEYDKGRVLFQKEVVLDLSDSAEEIATKVLKQEHRYYSQVIESFILKGMDIL